MGYVFAAISDVGTEKKVNEDSYFIEKAETVYGEACLAVVCDGVGGLAYGDRAGKFTIDKIKRWFKRFASSREIDCNTIQKQLNELIIEINHELVVMGNDAKTKLGTTVSMILFVHGKYYVCHVGDTRIYQFKDRMKCLTLDHTMIAAKVRNGQLTEEEAKNSNMGHVLLQCVGANDLLEIQNVTGIYGKNEVYLLCSDGQYNKLNIGEIEDILEEMKEFDEEEMRETALTLIDAVKIRGEKDNITTMFLKTV